MTERRLTDEQREIIADSIPGGLVAYIQRLSEGHWPTFGMGKQGRYLGSCICGEVLCHRWAIAAYRRDLLDAYQAKVDDFAAETLRAVPESDERQAWRVLRCPKCGSRNTECQVRPHVHRCLDCGYDGTATAREES